MCVHNAAGEEHENRNKRVFLFQTLCEMTILLIQYLEKCRKGILAREPLHMIKFDPFQKTLNAPGLRQASALALQLNQANL